MPSTSGFYGRQAGWQTKYGWISKFLNSLDLLVKLFGFSHCLISVQCYMKFSCNINHAQHTVH